MAAEQTNITETEAQVAAEEARVVVQAMATVNADNNLRLQNVVPMIGGPHHETTHI